MPHCFAGASRVKISRKMRGFHASEPARLLELFCRFRVLVAAMRTESLKEPGVTCLAAVQAARRPDALCAGGGGHGDATARRPAQGSEMPSRVAGCRCANDGRAEPQREVQPCVSE